MKSFDALRMLLYPDFWGKLLFTILCLNVLLPSGCGTSTNQRSQSDTTTAELDAVDKHPEPLTVLVVDDSPLAEAINSQWAARSGVNIDVRYSAWKDTLDGSSERLDADVIIYPTRMLGELVEGGLISTVPKFVLNDKDWAYDDIFQLIRAHEMTWGKKIYSVPLGSPQLMFVYRKDVFETGGLRPPRTWDELQELIPKLVTVEKNVDVEAKDKTPWCALTQPLAEGYAGQVLLARAAAYARHRSYFSTLFDYQTMEPRISEPPFLRALEQLVADASFGPANQLDASIADCRTMIADGTCAAALVWPGSTAESDEKDGAERPTVRPPRIALAELPGAVEMFNYRSRTWEARQADEEMHVPLLGVAGRLGSITRHCTRKRAAARFLAQVSGRQWSDEISPRSTETAPFRHSHLERPKGWISPRFADARGARDYVNLVGMCLTRRESLMTLRIPRFQQYMDALDRAVQASVRGMTTPREALDQAAVEWKNITRQIGMDRQRAAYQRSIGME